MLFEGWLTHCACHQQSGLRPRSNKFHVCCGLRYLHMHYAAAAKPLAVDCPVHVTNALLQHKAVLDVQTIQR